MVPQSLPDVPRETFMNVYLHLFHGNSTRVELRGLGAFSAVDTFLYVNSATVTVTLVDSGDVELSGESWPLTMSYESGSDGDYSGVVAAALSVTIGQLITAQITATDSGQTGYWEIPVEVVTRTHRYGYG